MNLTAIPAFVSDDVFHVVVEAPRGSNLKLKYEPRWQTMTISRPLPVGLTFPFDWGFIPSTQNLDRDPLDAMVLWDVSSYPGVVIQCRAIGVLQVEQNRTNYDRSERVRNDRVLVLPLEARREQDRADTDLLTTRVRLELEQFAIAAAAVDGKDICHVGWGDARTALDLIRSAASRQQTR